MKVSLAREIEKYGRYIKALVRTQESDFRVTFCCLGKHLERIRVSNKETSISVIVWKWSEETLLSKSLPSLLGNFRPFNFC